MEIYSKLLFSAVFCLLMFTETFAQTNELLPAFDRGQYGFIAPEGKMVIKPRFYRVGTFSQGLAPVREGASFGYINSEGSYVIPPRFEEAQAFDGKFATAVLEGEKYLIDKKGEILFKHDFADWRWADPDHELPLLIVETGNQKQGLANLSGKLLADPIYTHIDAFSNGRTIVYQEVEGTQEMAVMNAKGKLLTTFGEFASISPFSDGYAVVTKNK